MSTKTTKKHSENDVPLYLFHEGSNSNAYEYFGSHRKNKNTVVFRVWAPDAKNVSVTGDFNDWSETENPMKPLKNSGGVWEAEIKNIKPYDMYNRCRRKNAYEVRPIRLSYGNAPRYGYKIL